MVLPTAVFFLGGNAGKLELEGTALTEHTAKAVNRT